MEKMIYYIKRLVLIVIKFFGYHNSSDNSSYWRSRAVCSGSSAVLWNNKHYNSFVRKEQEFWLNKYMAGLSEGSKVLDFGCGVGYVSKIIININHSIQIDGVDFKEMVDEANTRNNHENINYLPLSQWDNSCEKYDVLLSSGTLSAIRDEHLRIETMEKFCDAAKSGSIVLMIDPFHHWSFLARAKMSQFEVIKFMSDRNFSLVNHSGMLFWPFRLFLSNSTKGEKYIGKWFYRGEKILNILGRKLWSDYKVLVFQKK